MRAPVMVLSKFSEYCQCLACYHCSYPCTATTAKLAVLAMQHVRTLCRRRSDEAEWINEWMNERNHFFFSVSGVQCVLAITTG